MSRSIPSRPAIRPHQARTQSSYGSRTATVTRGTLSYFTAIPEFDSDRWSPDDDSPPPSRKNVIKNDYSYADEGDEEKGKKDVEEEYSVLPRTEKRLLVTLIALAGSISGLSSNIYFPAQNAIARDLGVSSQQVSLTITSYLVIQGIAPLIWGPLSDTIGRRPVYLASFSIYVVANLVLSFTPNFTVLLIFRGLQSGGSASTASIGNGVLQDIIPLSARGGYISFYQAVRNFAVAFGPVLGGAFAQYLGFRAIFMFLLGLAAAVTIGLVIFLPETMRTLAGNGSWRLTGVYQSVYRMVWTPSYVRDPRPDEKPERKKVTIGTFAGPFKLLAQKEVAVNVYFFGLIYAVWSMVTSSTTVLFQSNFGFNELQMGFAYIPNGFGTIIGATIIGKLLNSDFATAASEYKKAHNMPSGFEISPKKVPDDFAVERLRLRRMPWVLGIFVVTLALYGFSLSYPSATARPGWVAVPLLLQFVIAASANACFSINQTLVSDLCPGKGASSTGINNLVRCGLAAVMVAFVEDMIMMLGPGATFLGLSFLVIAFTPLVVANWLWGVQWRQQRLEKERRKRERNGRKMTE